MLGALDEGPARLTAEEVSAAQRRRMLAAMVAAVAEKGYVGVAVADVVRRAKVSRATFYQHFTDKADCFIATFHACVSLFVGVLTAAMPDKAPPRERLHALLESYLRELAAFPEGARVCLVEVYAAGPEAVAHRRQIQLDFVNLFSELHSELRDSGEAVRRLQVFDFEALVGSISSLATNRVAMGEASGLPELLEPLESFVLRHFGLDDRRA